LKTTIIQTRVFAEIDSQTASQIVPSVYEFTYFDESRDPHLPEDREAHASHLEAPGHRPDLGLPQSRYGYSKERGFEDSKSDTI
jgi:hypothetical protein